MKSLEEVQSYAHRLKIIALDRELWNIVDVIVAAILIWDGSRKGR